MSLYTKTALKKIKKDALVEMFLDLQAKKVDHMMDEVVEKCCTDAVEEVVEGMKSVIEEVKEENETLKEENKKQKVLIVNETIEKEKFKYENEVLTEKTGHLKCIVDDTFQEMDHFKQKTIELMGENEKLKKEKIPDDIIRAFTGLTSNWWGDEEKFYSEVFEPEQEPEDIPTDKLEPCNYRDLRVLDEWFNKINQN